MVRSVHIWLGLVLGGIFVLLGVTGSALLFYQEIDALLHPEIGVTPAGPAPDWTDPAWDRALATVRSRWPDRTGPWRFEATGGNGPIPARYQAPHAAHHDRRIMVWLSPDGGRILREAVWGEYLMTFVYDLHMELALGETGHAAVGWIGVALALLLLSGLWAWWPRNWRKGLRLKPASSRSRRLYDIHKLAGLFSGALLLMLAITGAMLALPRQAAVAMAPLLGPVDRAPTPHSASATGTPISLSQALRVAHRELPLARLAWVEAPGPGDGAIMVRLQQPGDPSFRFPHSFVHVDQYRGTVLAVQDSRKAHAATTVNNWLHPLHDGSLGGVAFRILLSIVGLAPAVLFVTGLMRWRLRRNATVHSGYSHSFHSSKP